MSEMGAAVERVKEYAKNRIKRQLAKAAVKILKKLLSKAVLLIGKLLVSIAGLLGFKGIIAILVIIVVGGAVMYVMPFFSWFSGDSGSPKTPDELKAEYTQAYESTSEYEEYRPPQLLIQFIDNIRILKENKELWEINPKSITNYLKADITKESYTNVYKTTKTKVNVDSSNDEQSDSKENTSYPDKSESSERVSLVTKIHAWNQYIEISYKQEKSYSSNTTTDSNGNEINVSHESITWVESSRTSTPDYSKLDQALFSLQYSDSDFDLLVDSIVANDEDYLAGYNGAFGMIYGDDIGWWDEDSVPVLDGQWMWPTVSTRITSGFYIRTHPVTGEVTMHTGIDIGRPIVDAKYDDRAQPIFSVSDGIVTHAGTLGTYGTEVTIDHGNGLESIYGHLKSIDKSIKVGTKVTSGQVVGIMGSTGRSTGIHLHFSVKNNGKYDNPLKYLKIPG